MVTFYHRHCKYAFAAHITRMIERRDENAIERDENCDRRIAGANEFEKAQHVQYTELNGYVRNVVIRLN